MVVGNYDPSANYNFFQFASSAQFQAPPLAHLDPDLDPDLERTGDASDHFRPPFLAARGSVDQQEEAGQLAPPRDFHQPQAAGPGGRGWKPKLTVVEVKMCSLYMLVGGFKTDSFRCFIFTWN